MFDIKQHAAIMNDSMKLAHDGKTFATRLSRCDILIQHCEKLLKYEQKGIPTTTPLPSKIISDFKPYRDEIILEEAKKAADKAKSQAEVAATPTSKSSALGRGLLKVQEIKENSSDPSSIQEIESELKSLMHQSKLDGFLDAAKKAEFKGNKKKAIDQYQEALYFIKNDDLPDEQQIQEINEIESKIKELST
jgi:hypothetical protein